VTVIRLNKGIDISKVLRMKVDAHTVRMANERARQREELIRNAIAQGYTVRTLVTRETLHGQHMDYIIVDELGGAE
jgi:hypothetical protein